MLFFSVALAHEKMIDIKTKNISSWSLRRIINTHVMKIKVTPGFTNKLVSLIEKQKVDEKDVAKRAFKIHSAATNSVK